MRHTETAQAMKLEEYAEAKLSGLAHNTTAVCAMIVRLLKSTN